MRETPRIFAQDHMRLLLILPCVISIITLSCKSKRKSQSAYEFLKAMSTEINQSCPIQVDSVLKLESTIATPPATFRYNYTLKFDTVIYDIREFEKSLTTTTINKVKTSPDAAVFRRMFATLEYQYSDTLGNYLFKILVKPGSYLK